MIADCSSLPILEGLSKEKPKPETAPTTFANTGRRESLAVSVGPSLFSFPPALEREGPLAQSCFTPGSRLTGPGSRRLVEAFPELETSCRLLLPSKRGEPEVPLTGIGTSAGWGIGCDHQLAPIDAGNDLILTRYLADLANLRRQSPPAALSAEPQLFDDLAREQLVVGHLHRVVRMAFEFRGGGLPLGDLINEGNIGLMRAAELFDPNRKVSFGHYAKAWIRMQMKRAINYQAWPVSLPADFRWRRGQVLGTADRLAQTLNREPSETELAAACGLELPAVRRIRRNPAPTFVDFDAPSTGTQAGYTLAEVLADENIATPEQEAARRSDREFVGRLLEILSPCQQQVIRLRFGLDDGCARTLEEVAHLLGYVRQGIHRLETTALAKLRQHARFLQEGGEAGWARASLPLQPMLLAA